MIEECIGQIVLNKRGMDPDFRYKRLFPLNVEEILSRMHEIYGLDNTSRTGSDSIESGHSGTLTLATSGTATGTSSTTSTVAALGGGAAHSQAGKLWGSRAE